MNQELLLEFDTFPETFYFPNWTVSERWAHAKCILSKQWPHSEPTVSAGEVQHCQLTLLKKTCNGNIEVQKNKKKTGFFCVSTCTDLLKNMYRFFKFYQKNSDKNDVFDVKCTLEFSNENERRGTER